MAKVVFLKYFKQIGITSLQLALRVQRLCNAHASFFCAKSKAEKHLRHEMIPAEPMNKSQDRVDEFMAVINMIGYARGVAETLGVPEAASDLQSAGLKLALEIQREMSWNLTSKDIIDMAVTPHGRC